MIVCIYTYRFSEEKLLLCFVCNMIVPENFFPLRNTYHLTHQQIWKEKNKSSVKLRLNDVSELSWARSGCQSLEWDFQNTAYWIWRLCSDKKLSKLENPSLT